MPFEEKDVRAFVEARFAEYKFKDIFSESMAVRKKGVKDPPESITHQQSWTCSRFTNKNYDASSMPNRVMNESAILDGLGELRIAVNKTFFGSVSRSVVKELS